MTQHTAQPVSDKVLAAMGKMARQHMRAHGMESTRSVPWIRAQHPYEFASVGRWYDEAKLEEYLTNANQGSNDKAGILMLRRTRTTGSKPEGRIFIAFTLEYLEHAAHQLARVRP